MPHPAIVTLTTDFGTRDSYVGQMKAAALALEPGLQIVDVCHEVPPQDVAGGAYVLESAFATFPPGTIHVAVVDPGVGGTRRPIAARSPNYHFVAPDNGLLTRVAAREPLLEAVVLAEPAFRRQPASPTFEGRDVFAPAAAWLARGVELERLGPAAGELVRLPWTPARPQRGRPCRVRVIHVDRFGNVTLDVAAAALREALGAEPDGGARLRVDGTLAPVSRFHRTYAEATDDRPFLLINSAGYLELAVAGDSAAARLGLEPGAEVDLTVG
jgi:S-adenosylmethionine hydrolase